jgi:hypothetical protein
MPRFVYQRDSQADDETSAPSACGICGTALYCKTLLDSYVLNPVIRNEYGNAAKVRIELTVGENDSDIAAGQTMTYAICPKCFEHKLRPWLEIQGAKANVKLWTS